MYFSPRGRADRARSVRFHSADVEGPVEVATEDVEHHLAVAVAAVLLQFAPKRRPGDPSALRPFLRGLQRAVTRAQPRLDGGGQGRLLFQREAQPGAIELQIVELVVLLPGQIIEEVHAATVPRRT